MQSSRTFPSSPIPFFLFFLVFPPATYFLAAKIKQKSKKKVYSPPPDISKSYKTFTPSPISYFFHSSSCSSSNHSFSTSGKGEKIGRRVEKGMK